MNRNDLYRAIGQVDDDLLERSETPGEPAETLREEIETPLERKRGRKIRPQWMRWAAIAACFVLLAGVGGAVYLAGRYDVR